MSLLGHEPRPTWALSQTCLVRHRPGTTWGWSNIGESIYPDGTSCDLWNDENIRRGTYAEDSEDIIGLTLDVGAGTLTAKRGDEELGTVACGLPRGEAFVWFADMLGENRDEEDEAEPFSASVTFV